MTETMQQSIGSMVAQGLQFHQRGDLARAEQVYLAILMREPQNADALHLMGSVRGRQGLTAEAIRLMEKAIEANPRVSIYHNNLGNLKATAGDIVGAEESYRSAIKADRKNASAHLNLGKLLEGRSLTAKARECYVASLRLDSRSVEAHMSLGRLEESEGKARAALQSYCNAVRIDPMYAAGHLAVGNAQVKLKALEKAEESYRTAIALDPNYADALFNLANTVRELERPKDALEWYRRAIALPGPVGADTYNNYGLTLSDLNQHEEAEAAFRRAIELRPDLDDAYFNLGKELTTFGDRAVGMEMLRRAIEINPGNASAYLQLGTALHAQGFLQDAIAANRKALELDPSCQITRRNLGMVLASRGDAEGLDILDAMVRENPESVDLHWTRADKLLLHGRYEEGWREYEWRIQVEDLKWQHREFDVPRWAGEPLAGKKVLLYTEQGFGDTLQFARYARLLAERGGTVILEVQPGLKRWCAALPGVAECLALGEPLPKFDLYAPLMSLPYILGMGSTIPLPVAPWFEEGHTDEERGKAKLQVGMVWAGNPKHVLDQLRSTKLTEWSGLAKIAGVEFTSLQVGGPAAQIEEGGHGFEFADDCRGVRDFGDTAAVVAGLDLVITVDTAVAHLAGSMGKPVWILLYNVVDWRWGLEKASTPWYPTARLFRQTTPGDWSQVFAEVETSLREQVASR
jgi:tetratricopeptide (TPR) repeat protein